MPTVEIMVNGRRHAVQCGEGEESRVKRLASYVDRKVADLAKGQMQIGDSRLLIMASLMVVDELSDAFEEVLGTLEVPEIIPILFETHDKVAGIGEPAVIPAAAAFGNAVYNATGVRMRTLPMTPKRWFDAQEAGR